jgi:hypothetical protein
LAQFTILWLPSRYTQLIFYAIFLIIVPIVWKIFLIGLTKWRRRGIIGKRKVLKSRKKRDENTKLNWTAGTISAGKHPNIGFDV